MTHFVTLGLLGIRVLQCPDLGRDSVYFPDYDLFVVDADLSVDRREQLACEALGLVTTGTAGFHVSFDLDGMDPRDVPGTGTPVKGGISWREANLLMEMVSDTGKMRSLEVTELNPILDVKNQSGEVAVDVICSAFGKRIL